MKTSRRGFFGIFAAAIIAAQAAPAVAKHGLKLVASKARALKATWTMEMAADLRAVHGLDAEAQLANILACEIQAEINREIIREIHRRQQMPMWRRLAERFGLAA